ncbi:MFS transporter [Actinomadura scrupuli]|uniref:MFS transporter n=1 Tax=Actinomadura scrupuli TaxID=559629 RepID=UPI003D989DD6
MRPGPVMPGGHRVFLTGQAVSLLGDGLALLAIPLLVLQVTSSPLAASLAAAPRSIGYLFAGLPSGPLVDRSDPWRVLIAADVIRASVFLTLFVLATAHAAAVWLILALAFLAGGAGVFFDTALTIAIRDLYTGDGLVRANAFLEAAGQTSVVLGPAVVGVLAAGLGVRTALLINALTFAVSLATLFTAGRRTAARPVPPAASWRSLGAEFAAGLRYVVTTPVMLSLMLLGVMINLCLAVEKLIVFFARDTLGLTAPMAGLAVAGGGIGGIAGALAAPRLVTRVRPVPLMAVSAALIGAGLVLMSGAPGLWWLVATNLLVVWGTIVSSIVGRTLRQRIVPRALLGRVTSTVRAVVLAVTPVGAVLAGVGTELLGDDPRLVFLGAGAGILIAVPLLWTGTLRRHRHLTLDGT